MDRFATELNEVLVDTYHIIEQVEEQAVKNTKSMDLSISELHFLEAVGRDQGKTVSDIAQSLNVTLPSVTNAVNKLVKKGYVTKEKGAADGRTVWVTLTRLGKKMCAAHRYFHAQMVRNISTEFSDAEKEQVLELMYKLNRFFQEKLKGMES